VKQVAASQEQGKLQHLDFSSLESAISNVHETSIQLDKEKDEAERKFRHLLDQLPKDYYNHDVSSGLNARLRRLRRLIGRLIGNAEKRSHLCPHKLFPRKWVQLLDPSTLNEVVTNLQHLPEHYLRRVPIEEFIKAAKRVAAANNKLASFEEGFISKEGIKEREWYKHLGVAPGKWLGL
jgi:N-acetylated-alpha-linked acidic dipeptidase